MFRKQNATPSEIILKNALENEGVKVKSQVNDGYKTIDLVISEAKLNIEVDGPVHITRSTQIISDFKRSHYSDDKGYMQLCM
jgi:very-short-patch-repair endonuclease